MDSWIECDACSKWRRIPAAMADALDDDAPWTCTDNPNRAFASCSMAQELTNEQIDEDQEDDDSEVGTCARMFDCACVHALHGCTHARMNRMRTAVAMCAC